MKLFIDIGHPAHVHYFRNFIAAMKKKGHDIIVSARDKEVTLRLLDYYGIEYYNRGKGSNSLAGKFIYMLVTDIKLLMLTRKWAPDLFLSFGSPYAAHTAKLLNRPHIALTDTENARLGIFSFAPFSEVIITPQSFFKSFGSKQIRFNGFFELGYLHPDYFRIDDRIRDRLKISEGEKFVLFRFVSWNASHDIGQSGISDRTKIELVNLFLESGYKIFISSEGRIRSDLESYKINIYPEEMHSVLSEADFVISEGATMATEAALLGTPSLYVNSLDAGIIRDGVNAGLLYSFRSDNDLINKVELLLSNNDLKTKHRILKDNILAEKIDFTSFLFWFIENFPQSIETFRHTPEFQEEFLRKFHDNN